MPFKITVFYIEDSNVFGKIMRRYDLIGRTVKSNQIRLKDTLIGVDETAETKSREDSLRCKQAVCDVKDLCRIRHTMKVEAVVVETKEVYKKQ